MAGQKNKKFSAKTKLEAVIAHRALQFARKPKYKSIQDLCKKMGISRSHLREWARVLNERGPEIFVRPRGRRVHFRPVKKDHLLFEDLNQLDHYDQLLGHQTH